MIFSIKSINSICSIFSTNLIRNSMSNFVKINKYVLPTNLLSLSCLGLPCSPNFMYSQYDCLLSLTQFRSYICSIRAFTTSRKNVLSPPPRTHEWQPSTYPRIKQSYWHTEVLLPLCVIWDKAIKDFCTSHGSVIKCVHIILKKSNKSILWFIHID